MWTKVWEWLTTFEFPLAGDLNDGAIRGCGGDEILFC